MSISKLSKRKPKELEEIIPSSTKKLKVQDDYWWQEGPIYHIYPKSFNDTSGNGIGDLKGKIEFYLLSYFLLQKQKLKDILIS